MNRRKQFYFTAAGIVLLSVIPRLLRIRDALEYDEIWTLVNYASGAFRKIFTDLALPNNHPLNSLLIKLTYIPKSAPQWIRLTPFLAGVLAVPLSGVTAFGLWRRRNTALWAMFFLAVLPEAVFYSQQARGYSLQLCLLLLFTSGLVTVRKHPVSGFLGILLGSIGSMLTLPTSAFYLGAAGSAALTRCRREWKTHLPGAAALACGGLFCLIWVMVNLNSFAVNQDWGIPIDSPADFLRFLWTSMLEEVPLYLYPLVLSAFCLGFFRSWPVLWTWGWLLAGALLFQGGPARTYLPLVAATALAAGYGSTLLQRRFPKFNRAIFIVIAAAGIGWLVAAFQKPHPDWYALHEQIRKLPAEITVLLPAGDAYPVAWNNSPESYHDQLHRLAPLPPGRTRKLLILNRSDRQTLNGTTAKGAEQGIPIDVPGTPMQLDAMHGYLYGLEELKGAPNPGDVVIVFIRPLPDPEVNRLYLMFQEIDQSILLNLWLCPIITMNKMNFRYCLLGAKIDDPGKLDWELFLKQHPGTVVSYRVVPPEKRE